MGYGRNYSRCEDSARIASLMLLLIEANEQSLSDTPSNETDIVFNIAEGLRGPSREAQIPAILEMLGIPYTGSDSTYAWNLS